MPTPKPKRPIVLEGPDGAGKSTLGQALSIIFNIPYRHTGGPLKSFVEFDERMDWARREGTVIFDRTPAISGLAYSILQPTGESFVPGWDSLRRLNPHIIMCTRCPNLDDPEVLADYLRKQESKLKHKSAEYTRKVVAKAKEVQSRYVQITEILHERGMRPILYDWKLSTANLIAHEITLRERTS